MKYLVRFFVITFLMFGFKHSYADNHIVYIDMDKVLNESNAGLVATKELTEKHKGNIKYFPNISEIRIWTSCLKDFLKKSSKTFRNPLNYPPKPLASFSASALDL